MYMILYCKIYEKYWKKYWTSSIVVLYYILFGFIVVLVDVNNMVQQHDKQDTVEMSCGCDVTAICK